MYTCMCRTFFLRVIVAVVAMAMTSTVSPKIKRSKCLLTRVKYSNLH